MADQFKQALKDVTDICKFEFWLRFYYMIKEGDSHKIQLPESDVNLIQQDHPLLGGLATEINNEIMTRKNRNKKSSILYKTAWTGNVTILPASYLYSTVRAIKWR